MAKNKKGLFRKVYCEFWDDVDLEELTPENKYFFLCLLTNPKTNFVGIYQISIRQMAFYTGYNRETIEKLIAELENFGSIKYNRKNKEICILKWPKHNYNKAGKPVMDAIRSGLGKVKTPEFIKFQMEHVESKKIMAIYVEKYDSYNDTCHDSYHDTPHKTKTKTKTKTETYTRRGSDYSKANTKDSKGETKTFNPNTPPPPKTPYDKIQQTFLEITGSEKGVNIGYISPDLRDQLKEFWVAVCKTAKAKGQDRWGIAQTVFINSQGLDFGDRTVNLSFDQATNPKNFNPLFTDAWSNEGKSRTENNRQKILEHLEVKDG